MQPWQEKALAKGRTPLPESPGARPWLNSESRTDTNDSARVSADNKAESSRRYVTRATVAANNDESAGTAPAGAAAPATDTAATSSSGVPNSDQTGTAPQSYVFWRGDDLRRLVRMRNGGAKWSTISDAFPDRTLEALKQTYHKRRHATERLMAEEDAQAEAEAAGPSDGQ